MLPTVCRASPYTWVSVPLKPIAVLAPETAPGVCRRAGAFRCVPLRFPAAEESATKGRADSS